MSLIAGILVLIFCVCREDVVRYVHRTNWVQYYPFSKVLHDAKADRLVALDELERRVSKGLLTDAQAYAVVEAAFENDKPDARHELVDHSWHKLFLALDRDGLVGRQQWEQIFSRFAKPMMTVRPVIRQGDPLVIRVDYQSDHSSVFSSYSVWEEPIEVRVGGRTIHAATRDSWRQRRPDWTLWNESKVMKKVVRFESDKLPVGRWAVKYVGRHVFLYCNFRRDFRCRSLYPPYPDALPSRGKDIRLTGEVEILPANAPDPVRWVTDPSFKNEILGALDVRPDRACLSDEDDTCPVSVWSERGQDKLSCSFRFSGTMSTPIAFELILQAGSRELPTQMRYTRVEATGRTVLAWDRDEGSEQYTWATAIVPTFEEDSMYVILRASRDVARQTVDLYEIWKGELRFGPFKVEHVNPQDDADVDAP